MQSYIETDIIDTSYYEGGGLYYSEREYPFAAPAPGPENFAAKERRSFQAGGEMGALSKKRTRVAPKDIWKVVKSTVPLWLP